jgi:hypothetical protein
LCSSSIYDRQDNCRQQALSPLISFRSQGGSAAAVVGECYTVAVFDVKKGISVYRSTIRPGPRRR